LVAFSNPENSENRHISLRTKIRATTVDETRI
jgi:hypothetical protein